MSEAIEGRVVEGFHPMTYAGTCLECGRSDLASGCQGEGAVPVPTVDFGPPEPLSVPVRTRRTFVSTEALAMLEADGDLS